MLAVDKHPGEPDDSMSGAVSGEVTITTKSGTPVQMLCVNEHLFPMYNLVPDLGRRLTEFAELKLRKEDVVVCGFPRSGNHLLYETVHMLRAQTEDYNPDTMFLHALVECVPEDQWLKLQHQTTPRHFCTHMEPGCLPRSVIESGAKVVYIIRNPKDVYVSFYVMGKEMKNTVVFDGTWPDFLDLNRQEKCFYNSWFHHTRAWDNFQKKHPSCPIHVISYERMKLHGIEEIRRLAKFLEVNPRLAGHISTATNISQRGEQYTEILKKAKGIDDSVYAMFFKEGCSGVARKGDIGGWRKWFTVEQSLQLDQEFAEKMADSNRYTHLVLPYMSFAKL